MRAAIFIDGAYVLSHLKQTNLAPNYRDLADYLLKPLRKSVPLDLLRCYFYYCPPWMSPEPTDAEKKRMAEHEAFMEEITSLERWSVRLGKLQRRWDGHRETFEQKRVDVLLSVDMVRHTAAGHIQHAIVVAGDSDFIPAIESAKESGATVSLWCGDENTVHKDLVDLSDVVHRIDWKKFPVRKVKSEPGIIKIVQKKVEGINKRKPASARYRR
ncbi:MAG: NYN domain-containing protein [Spirochaetes bacterium]|nr:NYN domain-containing protein [Spirochaetota bacterium]